MDQSTQENLPEQKTLLQQVREWVQVIIIALIISLPIRFFIAEPFIVQGASMDPTFSTGQFLIIDRISYRFEQPDRGDVIVFKYPNNPKLYYIKRIIGLPGETVEINDGKVRISNTSHPDGIQIDEPYVETSHLSHENTRVDLGATEYFVMGDNRLQSSDSRIWGPLDTEYIIGRPLIRLVPLKNIGILPGSYTSSIK